MSEMAWPMLCRLRWSIERMTNVLGSLAGENLPRVKPSSMISEHTSRQSSVVLTNVGKGSPSRPSQREDLSAVTIYLNCCSFR